jgi:hypothetical protein
MRRIYLAAQLVGQVGCDVDLLVEPDIQFIKFIVDRVDPANERFNQLGSPFLQRRVSCREGIAVRIGDKYVVIEVRRQERHGAPQNPVQPTGADHTCCS